MDAYVRIIKKEKTKGKGKISLISDQNESKVRCIIPRTYYATHISSFKPQVMEKVGKILTISRASSMRTLGFHIITPSSTTFNCRISLVLCGTHDHPMSPDTYTAVVILHIWSQYVFGQTFTKITIGSFERVLLFEKPAKSEM